MPALADTVDQAGPTGARLARRGLGGGLGQPDYQFEKGLE